MTTLTELRAAYDHHQLAALFGVTGNQLLTSLYKSKSYRKFLIPKKSSGYRTITSPTGIRRIIQSQIKEVLDSGYRRPEGTHGFVTGRSVVTNATCHVGRRTIINLDLLNYFDAIDFYRVRGVFLSQPFSLNWVVSNILAQACTCNGTLMTGGITSPAISNLVTIGLDKRLARLAGRRGGRYTRYADDITLSFLQPPSVLQEFVAKNDQAIYEIGGKLSSEINDEGFSSNSLKFRVQTGVSRKSVTGLIVNKKVNLPRQWVRSLDSKIYGVEKFGIDKVALDTFPGELLEVSRSKLLRHLHGKVAYTSMVRGPTDWIAAGLANRINKLSEEQFLKVPDVEEISRKDRAAFGIWLVAAGDDNDLISAPNGNGTAFTFEKGYLVTAYHVIERTGGGLFPVVSVRRHETPTKLRFCTVVASCSTRDVAILRLNDEAHDMTRTRYVARPIASTGQDCWSLGFPQYFVGHPPNQQHHRVSSSIIASGVTKVRVTGGTILGGMSGAPLFDYEMKVIGFIHRGIANGGMADEAVAIKHASDLIP